MSDLVLEKIAACSILSIDIFDTLLFRKTHKPEDVFSLVEAEAKANGWLQDGSGEVGFREKRIFAQRTARSKALKNKGSSEVDIDEIYAELDFVDTVRSGLIALELEMEKRVCCLNPEVVGWIQAATDEGLVVVLASDMYWHEAQLGELLEACSLAKHLYDRVFVSCECVGDKASGAVFEALLKAYPGTEASSVLHIGDKLEADYNAALAVGMQAIQYELGAEFLSEVTEYEDSLYGGLLPELAFLRRRTAWEADGFFELFGVSILGPGVTNFCEWVLDRCEEEGIDLLCPMMREAEVFAPVLEEANRRRKRVERIESLYVSRSSTWLPSLISWDEESVEELLDRTGLRTSDALRYLELGRPEGFTGELLRSELRGEEGSAAREKLKAFLLEPEVCEKVEAMIVKRRSGLVAYLEGAFGEANSVATVDLGFRGTIASQVDAVLASRENGPSMRHWLMLGTEELGALRAEGMEIRGYLSEPGRDEQTGRNLRRTSFFLEQLLTGASGSVLGYVERAGNWTPLLGNPIRDSFTLKAKADTLGGILLFQRRFLEAKLLANGRLDLGLERCGELGAVLRRVVEWPTEEEGRNLGRLVHDFNGGAFAERRVCTEWDRRVLEDSGSVDTFLQVGRSVGVHWPEGVVAGRDGRDLIRVSLKGGGRGDSYLSAMYSLAEHVRSLGFESAVLYGAGDAGRTLAKAADLAGLMALCFVDRKSSLWGSRVDRVEVLSLEVALEKHAGAPILVGSFAFVREIERTVLEADPLAKLFSVKNLME